MSYAEFSPEIQNLILDPTSSSNPEAQQKIEQAYRDKYGAGDPDDEGAPKPPAESAVASPQQLQEGEIPADHIPTVQEAFGDQYQADYATCAKYVQDRFGDNREQFSRLEQAVVAEIGEVEALKLLRKLARK